MLSERIEELVPSLEQCIRLRALGMPQDSVFYWTRPDPKEAYELNYGRVKNTGQDSDSNVAAPTSAELGRMLPAGIGRGSDHYWLTFRTVKSALVDGWYWAGYYEAEEERCLYDTVEAHEWTVLSEAATRALLLIALIEGGDMAFTS